ncbi:MAG: cytochrome c maturation protein CcmE [Anaerolineae bacterium]|nr:cytochrome c maturation protein CcmE [Anaerolineae bacterium]
MTQTAAWEKNDNAAVVVGRGERMRFLIGGVIILVAVGVLILSGTLSNAQYFITVEELQARPELVGQTVRISGAVIGDTINYDADTLTITFTMAHIPEQIDDLALTLHEAVDDPTAAQINVIVVNEPMPDLLQNEAQAIVTGELHADGNFYADELLLKCPTRYEEAIPEQAEEVEAAAGAG